MKALHLTLQAFGPFPKNTCIDFTQLHQSPLFIINGPTGAGKSTLLDGICFALYGQTTGNERDAAQMRSDYAEDETITEVVFEFQVAAKMYRIRRLPIQWKAKSRGTGYRQLPSDAQAWEYTENHWVLIAKNVQETNEAVIRIIGLNAAQFRQVLVLPQGKFRDFLLADSKNREAILAKLFKTEMFSRVEALLKERAADIRQQSHDFEVKKAILLENVEAESLDQLQDFCVRASQAEQEQLTIKEQHYKELQDLLSAQRINQQNHKSHARLQDTQNELNKVSQEAEGIEQLKCQIDLHHEALKIRPQLTKREGIEKNVRESEKGLKELAPKLSEAKNVYTRLTDELDKATNAFNLVEDLKQRVRQAQESLTQLDLIGSEQAVLDKLNEDCLQTQSKLQKQMESLQALNVEYDRQGEKIESLNQLKTLWPELKLEKQQLEELIAKFHHRKDIEDQLDVLRQRFTTENAAFVRVNEQLDKAQTQLVHWQMLWHTQQAAILAQQLEEGHPCPVCGSKVHPAPCGEASTPMSQQQIEAQQAIVEKLREKRDQQWQTSERIQHQLESLEGELRKLSEDISDGPVGEYDEAKARLRKVGAQYSDIETEIKQEDKLQERKKRLEFEQEEARNGEKKLVALFEQIKQKHLSQTEKVEHLRAGLAEQFQQRSEIEEAVAQLNREIDIRQQNFQDLTKQVSEIQAQMQKMESQIELLEKQALAWRNALSSAHRELEDALASSPFSSQGDLENALLDDQKLREMSDTVERFMHKQAEMTALKVNLEKELANVVLHDLIAENKKIEDKQSQYSVSEKAWLDAHQIADRLEQAQNKLDALMNRHKNTWKQYEIVGTLAEVASGQNPLKINLQRFVLSVLLDDVLHQASLRLKQMSQGRYTLLRKEDKSKGNRASGLEIEVFDEYSGRSRSVATLSGGESFLAALSLALGLSDVVQAQSGGIQLDTLFIDEGFGSLDAEALDQALQVLVELRSRGRMIGLISHVSELKEQIPTRVDVIPSRTGSDIRLVCGV